MDIKDFRKLVNISPIKDKSDNFKIVLNYPQLDSKFELLGMLLWKIQLLFYIKILKQG